LYGAARVPADAIRVPGQRAPSCRKEPSGRRRGLSMRARPRASGAPATPAPAARPRRPGTATP